MRDDRRINAGYEIIHSVSVGNKEFVLGHNPKAPSPYVTWQCFNHEGCPPSYEWGHYFSTRGCAQTDLKNRASAEMEYQKQFDNKFAKHTQAPNRSRQRDTQDRDGR